MADDEHSLMGDGVTHRTSDALLRIVDELGGLKQALRTVVTHEKLISILNEQRKEVMGSVRDSETHIKSVLESQAILTDKRLQDLGYASDKRLTDLTLAIDRMLENRVSVAVKTALDDRDKELDKARKEIKSQAEDAVRGFKLFFYGAGPVFVLSLIGCGVLAWKMFFGGGL